MKLYNHLWLACYIPKSAVLTDSIRPYNNMSCQPHVARLLDNRAQMESHGVPINDLHMILFENRLEAGKILAEKLATLESGLEDPIVLGIPRGGIPVGFAVAKALNCPLDTVVLRKLPIPDNREAGFGAVSLDKVVVLNDKLLRRLNLPETVINKIIDDVYQEVNRRNRIYRKDMPFPSLRKRSVILTDDGLASGFTMLAGVKYARKKGAGEVIVGVPVAHRGAYGMIDTEADDTVALYVSDQPYFAVASFYKEFPEMSDEEMLAYLSDVKRSETGRDK